MKDDITGPGYDPTQTGPTVECAKCPPSLLDGRRPMFIDDELGRRAHLRTMGHRPVTAPPERGQ